MPTEPRTTVAERQLVPRVVQHLTADALGAVPFERLAEVKGLLKRYFSPEEWGEGERSALARAVGPGEGSWEREVDGFVVEYGWTERGFAIEVREAVAGEPPAPDRPARYVFSGPVVPEATPNPRTVMFRTGGVVHDGESVEFRRGEPVGDPRVSAVMERFTEISSVMVARDFVSVSLSRPADWEQLLPDVVDAVADSFAADRDFEEHSAARPVIEGITGASQVGRRDRPRTALDRAWNQLRDLDPADQSGREQLTAAARGEDANRRQVAAVLLGGAPMSVAKPEWERLLDDPSRRVRRAVADTVVDAGDEDLRPLLERALDDVDPWIRWKALRGLVELGPEASRGPITSRAADADFRVRLEAARALSDG